MIDLYKIIRKNFIVAFKYDINNLLSLLPLIFIGLLIFKNKHYDIMTALQIMSSFASVGVSHSIINSVMKKEDIVKTSPIIKSLPLKQRSIVIGFYMFSASIILITALVVSIFPAVKSVIEKDIIYLSSTFIINIIFCILIFSIVFPFIYKFGYSKTKTIITIIINGILPLMLLFYYIQGLYTRIYFITEAEYIFNMITNNITIIAIGCLFLYLISMAISIKEFS